MAFIDEMKIYAEAGRGGDGVIRWRKEKFVPKGGPAGGDGGRGGDFYVQAIRDVHVFAKYKSNKEFAAERGEDGGKKSLHGKNGEDYILKLPVGTIITNLETDETWQLEKDGEKIMLLRGGHGGFGNEHFKSSINTTPYVSRPGAEGEKGNFKIELELFADIGLVGLPNAGKSSLLNALTNADAKVGDYAFTTLDPNLGDFYGYIVADIPGIIEGANQGKGLGIKFLRHIKRTKMLAHLVSFDFEMEQHYYERNYESKTTSPVRSRTSKKSASSNGMLARYKEIRKELEKYDKKLKLGADGLAEKEEIIILTKADAADAKVIKREVAKFKKIRKKVFVISLFDDKMVKDFKDALVKILKNK